MDKFAKAIGAAQGGATSAMAVIAAALGILQLLPAGTQIPWWGYFLAVLIALIVCMVPPAIGTYLAPANVPAVGDPVTATVPATVAASPTPPVASPVGSPAGYKTLSDPVAGP